MSAPLALSVVVNVDEWRWTSEAVTALERQDRAREIELVLVTPDRTRLGLPPGAGAGLGAVRVVEHPIVPVGDGRAAGIRHCSAPLVVVGETHVYPDPGWADALIAAHAAGAAAIVPEIGNANPSALSWAGLVLDYGACLAGQADAIDFLPRNNVALDRAMLERISDGDIGTLLGPFDDVLRELERAGGKAVRVRSARIVHVNVATPRAWAIERFSAGRMTASSRALRWGLGRRLTYAAASPLIGVVIAGRGIGRARRAGRLDARVGAAVAAAGMLQALGELAGYLAPDVVRAEQVMQPLELHKIAYAGRSPSSGGRGT